MQKPGEIATKDIYAEHPTRPGAKVLVAREGARVPSNVVRITDAPSPTHKALSGPRDPSVVQADGDETDVDSVDYSKHTVPELTDLAKERGIEVPADARKQQLIDMLTYDDESRGV